MISFRISSCGISSHSSLRAVSRSLGDWTGGWQAQIQRSSISHTCLMGFASGLHASHSNRFIPTLSRKAVVVRATCGRALSCIKRNSGPTNLVNGTTYGRRMSSMYECAVTVHSGRCGGQCMHHTKFLPIPLWNHPCNSTVEQNFLVCNALHGATIRGPDCPVPADRIGTHRWVRQTPSQRLSNSRDCGRNLDDDSNDYATTPVLLPVFYFSFPVVEAAGRQYVCLR